MDVREPEMMERDDECAGRLRRRACLMAVGGLWACSSGPPATTPRGPVFDAYAGGWPTIFDDQIDPAAVGMSLSDAEPADDPQLRPRVLEAELVARVRVQTVTRESIGAQLRYLLTLEVGQPPLTKPRWETATIELRIEAGAPAFTLVRGLDERMRGQTFVGFFRRFDEGGPQPVVHFHLTTDSAEVARAVEQIDAFDALSGG